MDPRLRTAVDASVGWYEDLCSVHGVATTMRDGLWSSVGPPPPLHSHAVVVEPEVSVAQIMERLEGRQAGVKDSFATADLSDHGMRLLFAASWMFRPAQPSTARPSGWSVVSTKDALAQWTALHDTREVLLPRVLGMAHFKVVARRKSGQIIGGAVLRLGSGAVDVSNVYAVDGHPMDWEELAAVAAHHFPHRPLVGYERGDALAGARDGGFITCGNLRVFVHDSNGDGGSA